MVPLEGPRHREIRADLPGTHGPPAGLSERGRRPVHLDPRRVGRRGPGRPAPRTRAARAFSGAPRLPLHDDDHRQRGGEEERPRRGRALLRALRLPAPGAPGPRRAEPVAARPRRDGAVAEPHPRGAAARHAHRARERPHLDALVPALHEGASLPLSRALRGRPLPDAGRGPRRAHPRAGGARRPRPGDGQPEVRRRASRAGPGAPRAASPGRDDAAAALGRGQHGGGRGGAGALRLSPRPRARAPGAPPARAAPPGALRRGARPRRGRGLPLPAAQRPRPRGLGRRGGAPPRHARRAGAGLRPGERRLRGRQPRPRRWPQHPRARRGRQGRGGRPPHGELPGDRRPVPRRERDGPGGLLGRARARGLGPPPRRGAPPRPRRAGPRPRGPQPRRREPHHGRPSSLLA